MKGGGGGGGSVPNTNFNGKSLIGIQSVRILCTHNARGSHGGNVLPRED